MTAVRVLVVEDSITVRKYMVEVLSADPDVVVVGEATDGKQAIELCERLRPDVLTLDMVLPVMSGQDATEHIMAYCPTPILIVSASINRGELFKTYSALAAGALDVLDKPREHDADWAGRLVSTVKLLARIKVITHPRARLGRFGQALAPATLDPPRQAPPRLIALGVSTGGPGALVEILRGLPSDFAVPIVVVMHLGVQFASAFAEWLGSHSPIPVSYAKHGSPLPSSGCVLIAAPDSHLVLKHGRLQLTDSAPRHSCRPAVDVLFESLAVELGEACVACVLTGMGRDGAAGLLAIRQAGGTTFAQDEATSVVFGMPREAIQLGAAQRVLPLAHFARTFVAMTERRTS